MIFVFSLFLCFTAHADLEFIGDTIQVSEEYYSGPNLIYDCKKGSYICVDDDNVKECAYRRAEAKKFFRTNLDCAFFKRFENILLCQNYQQKKVNNPEGKQYCIHREKKKGTTHN
ncbi:MAG: hypothetical protein ACOYL6_11770 [Bacteriovoracaceae bacterium]